MIAVKAPACLPLGVTKLLRNDNTMPCLLGLTITYPPVHLTAEVSQSLGCTGPRANVAYDDAAKVIERGQLSTNSEIEIELAIPLGMGLFSETILALSTATAVAWANNLAHKNATVLADMLDLGTGDALGLAAFDRGGLLMVDLDARRPKDAVVERWEIAHERKDAWALVIFLPKMPEKAPRNLEARLKETATAAALEMDVNRETELNERLVNALASDDIDLFGSVITELQERSFKAMKVTGGGVWETEAGEVFFEVMRSNGAFAWGQSLTGLALWALLKGEVACIETQKALHPKVGYYSGRILSAITDNAGAQFTEKDDSPFMT